MVEMTGPHKDVSKQKEDKENITPTQESVMLLADYSHPQVQEAKS